jgi:hypothetical protein
MSIRFMLFPPELDTYTTQYQWPVSADSVEELTSD